MPSQCIYYCAVYIHILLWIILRFSVKTRALSSLLLWECSFSFLMFLLDTTNSQEKWRSPLSLIVLDIPQNLSNLYSFVREVSSYNIFEIVVCALRSPCGKNCKILFITDMSHIGNCASIFEAVAFLQKNRHKVM